MPTLTTDFDFPLPEELIAQHPTPQRDQSRLLGLHRSSGTLEHKKFADLVDFLVPGDLLIFNDSKVIPARMRGVKKETGGAIEFLLLEENALNDWWVMLKPAKRLRPGDSFFLAPSQTRATLLEKNAEGHCRLRFEKSENILIEARAHGEMPLPPYIARKPGSSSPEDLERYQTIYAKTEGSVAAPTAGLHFTPEIFQRLRDKKIEIAFVTLHVGAGTFAPVKTDRIEDHRMHTEPYEIPADTFQRINEAKKNNHRIIAIGTTSLRVLESAARDNWQPGLGRTNIFIYPPFDFKIVNALLTNFHLPKSTLLMLVSAFAAPNSTSGREKILTAYSEAIQQRYRFFSYGDAMLIH